MGWDEIVNEGCSEGALPLPSPNTIIGILLAISWIFLLICFVIL